MFHVEQFALYPIVQRKESMTYEERLQQAKECNAQAMERVKTTDAPNMQKFKPNTFVRIKADLGPSMQHFKSDAFAKVLYTFAHAFGGANVESYFLLVKNYESNWEDYTWIECGWYYEHQLVEVTDLNIINDLQKEIDEKPIQRQR